MTVPEREGLIARITQIRRLAAAGARRSEPVAITPEGAQVQALEERVTHLERLVEGLQDSVHRESQRQGKLIAELHAQIQPAAIAAALDQHARERGL